MSNPTLDVLTRKRERLLAEMAEMEPGKALDDAQQRLSAIEQAIANITEFDRTIRREIWT